MNQCQGITKHDENLAPMFARCPQIAKYRVTIRYLCPATVDVCETHFDTLRMELHQEGVEWSATPINREAPPCNTLSTSHSASSSQEHLPSASASSSQE